MGARFKVPFDPPFDPSTGSGLRTGFDPLRRGSGLRTGFGGAQGSGQASPSLGEGFRVRDAPYL